MRLIDADAVYNKAVENQRKGEIEDWEADSIIDYLDDAPTINDAEIVVRCRDCKYCHCYMSGNIYCKHSEGLTSKKPDDFCSYGEYQTNTGGATE